MSGLKSWFDARSNYTTTVLARRWGKELPGPKWSDAHWGIQLHTHVDVRLPNTYGPPFFLNTGRIMIHTSFPPLEDYGSHFCTHYLREQM